MPARPYGPARSALGHTLLWLLAGVLGSGLTARGQDLPPLEMPMFEDPRLDIPEPIVVFRPGLKELWIKALQSPEADLRQRAAFTLAWARERGMEGLEEAVEPLAANLADPQRIVRLAAARALTALDARPAAAALRERARQDGLEMAQWVEPALAVWRDPPMRDVWRRRLRDPAPETAWLLLAIQALAEVRDEPSSGELQQIAVARSRPPEVRLAAATALGQIRPKGLEAVTRRLLADRAAATLVDRLVAARLLARHDSAEARGQLLALARDDEPAVGAMAAARLLELDPHLLLPLAGELLPRGDEKIRRLVARALIAVPSQNAIRGLGELLGDPHPGLRAFVGDALFELAQADAWRTAVIAEGERMIEPADRWQGVEQSLRLLARLDQKNQAGRCLQLLSHPRWEVSVTAAWALRRLAVPETLAPALEFAGRRGKLLGKPEGVQISAAGLEAQLAQLFQFFGQQRFAAAEPLLRVYLAEKNDQATVRGAAIWALGWLHEGDPDADLASALVARLKDVELPPGEHPQVRRFAAVSLGRMKAQQALPALRQFSQREGLLSEVGYACAWSLHQITGQPLEPPTPATVYHTNFFLEPLARP